MRLVYASPEQGTDYNTTPTTFVPTIQPPSLCGQAATVAVLTAQARCGRPVTAVAAATANGSCRTVCTCALCLSRARTHVHTSSIVAMLHAILRMLVACCVVMPSCPLSSPTPTPTHSHMHMHMHTQPQPQPQPHAHAHAHAHHTHTHNLVRPWRERQERGRESDALALGMLQDLP